ncbi:MAG: phosphonate ABC transporter, permease protein PhnE, partial [Pseudomonadota bacterium]
MTAITLDAATRARLKAEHGPVFVRTWRDRIKAPLVVFGVVAYCIFCVFFFRAGEVLGEARWERAGAYLADWVSYEVRPEVRNEGEIELRWPRFSPLGPDPDPDWVEASDQAVVFDFGFGRTATITIEGVEATRGGETVFVA